jgi:mono/diheme cytochrome c family protein
VVFLVFLGILALSGCDSDFYSDAIRYLLRTDPLVTEKLGSEVSNPDNLFKPDRPGQMPIMSPEDLREFPNPFYKDAEHQNRDDLFRTKKLLNPTDVAPDKRQKLQETLDELFGTPRRPKVSGIEPAQIEKLMLDEEKLLLGSRYYRKDCLHCHGVTGNGRGPTARWVNPHPRDYRQGRFKFQSVDQAKEQGATLKPRREDLLHTLMEGLEGTAMPSFRLHSQKDLNALVSYVIHLSIRGEAEYQTIKAIFDDDSTDPVEYAREYTKKLGLDWAAAQDKAIQVVPYPYKESELEFSVQRGHALFMANEEQLRKHFPGMTGDDMNKLKGASCVSCHKDYGRQATYKFDEWGTLIKPTDLTRGVYRGGRTPTDLYYRIHSGINGSGMANFGGNLTTNQIWDLINFVRVLPYPGMREKYAVQIN